MSEAETRIADKIVTMLDQRSRGQLNKAGDDFVSGLIKAYGLVAGIDDIDVAYESAKARGTVQR